MNNELMFSSKSNEWETPKDLFDELNKVYHFTLDPCATHENHKCKKYYTMEDDGLSKSWEGETVFVNPPYGNSIKKWVKKCYQESKHATIVMLIPARTDTSYFHDYILNKAEVRFLRGRLKFVNKDYKPSPAPFPSIIVVYKSPATEVTTTN